MHTGWGVTDNSHFISNNPRLLGWVSLAWNTDAMYVFITTSNKYRAVSYHWCGNIGPGEIGVWHGSRAYCMGGDP